MFVSEAYQERSVRGPSSRDCSCGAGRTDGLKCCYASRREREAMASPSKRTDKTVWLYLIGTMSFWVQFGFNVLPFQVIRPLLQTRPLTLRCTIDNENKRQHGILFSNLL